MNRFPFFLSTKEGSDASSKAFEELRKYLQSILSPEQLSQVEDKLNSVLGAMSSKSMGESGGFVLNRDAQGMKIVEKSAGRGDGFTLNRDPYGRKIERKPVVEETEDSLATKGAQILAEFIEKEESDKAFTDLFKRTGRDMFGIKRAKTA